MSALRVGLIGCGDIARLVHLPLLTRLPDVILSALAESDPQRREEGRRRVPSAAVYASYEDLLETSDVDAVVICVPSALHAEVAIAALEKGKHVYLEKPLATTLADGQRVLEAWCRARLIGMIGFNYRFNALYGTMKEHIRGGTIDPLVSVRSVFSTAAHALPSWKQTRLTGGGVLLDLASHHIDLVRFLFAQDVCEVFASFRSQRNEGDSATLQLRLADGLLVQSFFSLNAIEEDSFAIYGHAGRLAVDRHRSFVVEVSAPHVPRSHFVQWARKLWGLRRSPYLLSKLRASGNEPSYRAALTHFVTAIRTNQPAYPDFWDGYCSLAVIAAAEESVNTGQTIVVANTKKGDLRGNG